MASMSHQQWAAEEGMDTPSPPHHHQQQQAHAGPDQEVMEVKQLLQQTLGGAGILNYVKALLVAGVHLATDGIREGQRPEASVADLRLLHPNQRALVVAETEEGRLALGLVADLLESLGLRQSLSVLLPEANLDDGRAAGEQQQQQEQPSQWRSQRQAQAAVLGVDFDAGSEDSLLLQFVRRQVQQQRLRSGTEPKEGGEEGEGEGGEEEGEGEATLAPAGQEQPLAVVQREAEKEGDGDEEEEQVEEAIAYEEEEGEGGSRNDEQQQDHQEGGGGGGDSALDKSTGERSGSDDDDDDDNDDEAAELRHSMDKVAIAAEAEARQEQEEEEESEEEEEAQEAAVAQTAPTVEQQVFDEERDEEG